MALMVITLTLIIIVLIAIILFQASQIKNINKNNDRYFDENEFYNSQDIFGFNKKGIMGFLNMSFALVSEYDKEERLYAGHYLLKNMNAKFLIFDSNHVIYKEVTSKELLLEKDKREYLFSKQIERPKFYDHWSNLIQTNKKLNAKNLKKLTNEYDNILKQKFDLEQINEFKDYMEGRITL
ncbi:hypothetical protein [Staphylococcus phage S6]|nr:hypothetical protein [Staphylococcus phage S6]